MSVEGVSSLLMTSSPGRSHTLPVEHLDYTYIQQCGDLKYLEKILHVLRSGKEGAYPRLTDFCEKRMESLEPRHRALRKDTCPATAASFSADEWKQITDDLQAWQREITESEQQLTQSPMFNTDTLPPVHNRTLQKPANTTATTAHSKRRAVPRAYSNWDRLDVDKECTKIDEEKSNSDAPAVINSAHTRITPHIDTSALTQQEKCVLAIREREKGNEAFRARDWDEAIVYYTRSLCILPTVAGFNNRAQAEIKLQRWTDALRDCDAVLNIETHNCKALLRRAAVYTHLEKLQAAHDDITTVLHSEPHNITAQKLLQEVNKKINTELQHKPRPPNQPIRGKKLLIQEVDEEKEEETSDETDGESAGADKQAQRDMEGRTDGEMERQMEIKTDGEMERQMEIKTDGEMERQTGGVRQGVDAAAVRSEGNELYRNGQYGDAAEKYTHSITTLTQSGVYSEEEMFVLYCNRAACFLKMGQCTECVSDCCRALQLKPFGVKALLRRAMAFETLEKFRLAYVDYRTVQQTHNTHSVQQHVNRLTQVLMEQDGSDWRTKLPEVPFVPISARHDETPPTVKTPPTKQCPPTMEIPLHTEAPPISGPSQTRRRINIEEVESEDEDDEDEDGADDDGADDDEDEGGADVGDEVMTSSPANAFEFGQVLNAARCRGDLAACARLLRSVSPHTLPHHISTQLDTHTLSFIIHTLHTHILPTEPGLVYRLLTHLHAADRFTVVLMLMDSDERRQITRLFECLCAVECDEFSRENINSLANKFI
ncbi:sperm-associated antigen 1 isoform X2 [Pangasianodon hypophthalmus]|uniref:sperm-associated antigen 1 isoform X2 n=1 Tax=Pangasianodon hypophthalmus TaxID=310915 RepID=UPI0023072487|nr:sperm-associated antigen 1 isoform X2 [Pangasianodon hypophthalmus]